MYIVNGFLWNHFYLYKYVTRKQQVPLWQWSYGGFLCNSMYMHTCLCLKTMASYLRIFKHVTYCFHIYLDNVFHGNQIYIYMYNCIPFYSIFLHSNKDVMHMDLVYLLNITDVLIHDSVFDIIFIRFQQEQKLCGTKTFNAEIKYISKWIVCQIEHDTESRICFLIPCKILDKEEIDVLKYMYIIM